MHTAHASKYGIYIYICNPDVEHKLVGCAQPRVECRRQTHSIAQMRNNDSLWHNVIYTRQYLSEYFTRTANVHQEFCKFIGVCLRNGIWFASCSASAGTCLLCMKKLCWFVVASIARQTSIFVLWRICFDIISVRMSTDGGGDETRGAYPVNSVLCKCVSKLSFPQNEIVIIFWLKSLAIKRVRRSQHFLLLLNYTHLNRKFRMCLRLRSKLYYICAWLRSHAVGNIFRLWAADTRVNTNGDCLQSGFRMLCKPTMKTKMPIILSGYRAFVAPSCVYYVHA